MSNNTLTYLMIVVIVVMAGMLLLNFMGFWEASFPEKYISKNDVRGIDVDHNGKLWTLNFEQQNALINALNASIATEENVAPEKLAFGKIVIYMFNKPDVVVTPLNVVNRKLVFRVPPWNGNNNLKEFNPGEIQKIVSETYDP